MTPWPGAVSGTASRRPNEMSDEEISQTIFSGGSVSADAAWDLFHIYRERDGLDNDEAVLKVLEEVVGIQERVAVG